MKHINNIKHINSIKHISIKNTKGKIRRFTAFVIAVILIFVANLNLTTVKADDSTVGQTSSKTGSITSSATGSTVSLSGVIVCENCRKASPVNHTRKCTQMKSCEASGYGILVAQADKTYKFYKFDVAGDAKAPAFLTELETAGVVKYLSVVVTGTYASEQITSPSGEIYDGFNVTGIAFDASHSSFEANAVSIKDNSNITVAAIENQIYTGSETKPAVSVLDGEYKLGVSDYITTYTNNIEAGTATATITGIGAYYKGTITKTFRIFKDADALGKAVKEGITYDTPIGILKLHELKITALETASTGLEKVSKELEAYIKSISYQIVQSVSFDIEPLDENGDSISLLENEYIVIRIPIPEGYDTSKIVVYHVEDNGDIEVVADASDIAEGKIIINAKSFSPYVVAETSIPSDLLANKVAVVETPAESDTGILAASNATVAPAILDTVKVEATISPKTGDNSAAAFYWILIFGTLFFAGCTSITVKSARARTNHARNR